MEESRRSFLGALMAVAPVAAVATVAGLPEPSNVSHLNGRKCYVMEFDGWISDAQAKAIKEQWEIATDGECGKLMILQGGTKLKAVEV